MTADRVPAAPPRDALLRDQTGLVWEYWDSGRWAPANRTSPTLLWDDLIDEHGPVDVLVWRHTARLGGDAS